MKIVAIFAPYLYAIAYPKDYEIVWSRDICAFFEDDEIGDIDEFQRIFELWSNPFYLHNFFTDNADYLNTEYWTRNNIHLDNLPRITKNKAQEFEEKIELHAENLDELFQPLDDRITIPQNLSQTKSKNNWLRIYAIKIDKNKYLITGGAIKLTHKMSDHPMTKNELIKIEKVENFLFEQSVFDSDSYDDMLYELRI